MTEKRLRIVHLTVQPVVMWDDGEEMHPGPALQPVQVPFSGLTGLRESLPVELAQLEAQLLDSEKAVADELAAVAVVSDAEAATSGRQGESAE